MDIGVIPNATILVQLAIFVIFLLIINNIYVRPYTDVIESRDNLIKRNLAQAEELRKQATQYLNEAKLILEEAKKEADSIIEKARKEAEEEARKLIEGVEKLAEQEVKEATEEIRKSLAEEKKKLEKAVKELALEIVKKILREAA
ncbi:MAG: F0F1 ATP synthase subunit B [Aquificae bacterium]|nr:F0F1 ATP synthase subunit B [Aquificota bacterium]